MTYSRRTVLAGLGMAALAGCTGEGVSPSSSGNGGGSASEGLSAMVDGETIQIEVLADSVESVSVIDPEGRLWTERPVSAGVTRVDVGLDERYTPGEFRIVGVSGGETVAETRLEITPDLRIVEVGIGEENPDRMPSSMNLRRDSEVFVTIENRGSGFEVIDQLTISGDVPSPTSPDTDRSGLYGEGGRELSSVIIRPDEQLTVFSSTLPFNFGVARDFDCGSPRREGVARFRVHGSMIQTPVEYSASIEYATSTSKPFGCEVRVN